MKPIPTITLTVEQIKNLAEFAGLRVKDKLTEEDKETEITITTCPKQGILDDDESIIHCKHIAYLEEYPEEGVCPLDPTTPQK